jgi:hypothetical protein
MKCPTPPNSPNSSPELTEVGLVVGALAANLEIPTDQLIELQATGNLTTTAYLIVQALSTKNELSSEIEGLVERLLKHCGLRENSVLAREAMEQAAQAILSLQRRLESVAQFALDLAGGRVMGDGLDELRRRADAALNPKDTGR